MNIKVGFNTPIISNDTGFAAVNAFDDYFSLSGNKCRVIHSIGKKDHLVKSEKVKPDIPLNILKVISYITMIVPLIMLIGKAIVRLQHNFYTKHEITKISATKVSLDFKKFLNQKNANEFKEQNDTVNSEFEHVKDIEEEFSKILTTEKDGREELAQVQQKFSAFQQRKSAEESGEILGEAHQAKVQNLVCDPRFREKVMKQFQVDGGVKTTKVIMQSLRDILTKSVELDTPLSFSKFMKMLPSNIDPMRRYLWAYNTAQKCPKNKATIYYVSIGSGCLLQDLLQVIYILETRPHVQTLQINLFDYDYIGKSNHCAGWEDGIAEFEACLRCLYPEKLLEIGASASFDKIVSQGDQIDVLSGIRLSLGPVSPLRYFIDKCMEKLSPEGGSYIIGDHNEVYLP